MTLRVLASDLRSSFDFVGSGAPSEHNAYVCLETGKIYWESMVVDLEEDLPDDFESSDRYLALPHKNELGLGRDLVFTFAEQEMPEDGATIARYFRRRGAYARFKDLLIERGLLSKWYDFESRATDEALREWCDENDIQLDHPR